ncbi:hypothetical protein EN932_04205 [Mesorhizobium sp. M7A.F.Ca.US.002.01.1.1]|uniref:hypothetical protein n=1 Tax=Mesorhizobium sp. M7A.F.Ca.US.002.01.1.1 TaxID=2496700 RepID=UPI000FD5BEF2|nr:hypothetical protein [Mesorhizobium sp. M7A.F.Ca.US.002.01.1.1]RVA14643.1 hypothetical protein EN932_04205 [Mesorhizobium sp. M7A.F.Ca.US.002.01.1.1]
MFPKSGNKFPEGPTHATEAIYAAAIAKALASEVGASRLATKTVMFWTGASDRSARHWLNGDHGPGGLHLILLARNSTAVMRTVMRLADRQGFELAIELSAARTALIRATAIVEALSSNGGKI